MNIQWSEFFSLFGNSFGVARLGLRRPRKAMGFVPRGRDAPQPLTPCRWIGVMNSFTPPCGYCRRRTATNPREWAQQIWLICQLAGQRPSTHGWEQFSKLELFVPYYHSILRIKDTLSTWCGMTWNHETYGPGSFGWEWFPAIWDSVKICADSVCTGVCIGCWLLHEAC